MGYFEIRYIKWINWKFGFKNYKRSAIIYEKIQVMYYRCASNSSPGVNVIIPLLNYKIQKFSQ